MRRIIVSLSAMLLVAACAAPTDRAAGPGTPVRASIINPDVDLVGSPDLIVHEPIMKQQWVVRDENLPANFCSVIEGGVTPGVRRLVRFTVMTPNIGDADVFIGNPHDYVDAAGNSDLFEFADCHAHYHFKHYATYELVDMSGNVWRAAKRGFCMLDTDPAPSYMHDEHGEKNYLSCGSLRSAGFQGVSGGWSDTYRFTLGGQYFILDGGDGQPVVPPGDYIIRITVNPGYAPIKGKCPRAQDPATGLCHQFAESDYSNNVGQVVINIPETIGRGGHGPASGSEIPKTEPAEH